MGLGTPEIFFLAEAYLDLCRCNSADKIPRFPGSCTASKRISWSLVGKGRSWCKLTFQLDTAIWRQKHRNALRKKWSAWRGFFDRITGIQVVVDLEHRETPVVELCASVEHAENFIATDRGELISTLDRVIHKIEEQLRRHKKKITGHRATSHKHLEVPDKPQAESE